MSPIKKRGMASIEALLILPVLCTVILLFMNMLIFLLAKSKVDLCIYKSSYFFYNYSYIFHEKGLASIENKGLELLNKKVISQGDNFLIRGINSRYIFESLDDLAYREITREVFLHYLKEEESYKNGLINFESINFNKSKFFNKGDRVELKLVASLKPLFPLFDGLLGPIKIESEISFRTFSKGDMPKIITKDQEELNVWALDPLERGRVIREAFGANLPFNYPVVAIYESGKVSMIKSLDHTCPSYENKDVLYKTIKKMIDNLYAFEGRNFAGTNIEAKDIKARELILVMPENSLTMSQENAIREARNYSMIKGITFNLKNYQVKEID